MLRASPDSPGPRAARQQDGRSSSEAKAAGAADRTAEEAATRAVARPPRKRGTAQTAEATEETARSGGKGCKTRGAARPAKKGQRPHAPRYGTAPRDAHTAQPPDAGDLRRSSFLSPAPDTRPDAPPAKPRQDTDTRPEAPPAKTEQDPATHRPTPNTAAPRHAPIRPKISRR